MILIGVLLVVVWVVELLSLVIIGYWVFFLVCLIGVVLVV